MPAPADPLDSVRHLTRLRLATSLAVVALLAAAPASGREDPQKKLTLGSTSAGNSLAAQIALYKKDVSAAAAYYREALRGDPRNSRFLESAFVLSLANGEFSEAQRLSDRITARDQRNVLANLFNGVRQLKNKQFALARASFGKAGGRGKNAELAQSLLTAWAWAGTGDHKKAMEIIDRFASDSGLNGYRNFFGGLISSLMSQEADAAKRLKTAYDADPLVVRVADAYARFEARRGNIDLAKQIYAKFEETGQSQPLIAQPLAELRAGRVPEPLVASVAEGAAEVFYGLGQVGGRGGDETAALIYLQFASYLDPNHEIAFISLAELFDQMEQYERAADAYGRVPESSPLKGRASIRYALSLEKLERTEDGLTALRNEIKREPGNLDVREMLAALLRSKKRWTDAIDAYGDAFARISKPERRHWNLYYGRGIAHERAKAWPKAEADFKLALTLLPEEPKTEADKRDRAQVLNYLAYSWVDMGINVAEAFPMLRKAVDLQPKDGYILDSLGWAYYKLGQYDDAVRELERAVELRPADPVINDHLGDSYWKVGRKLEAQFQWAHARDLKPEPEDLAKVLNKIENGMDDVKPAASGGAKPADGDKPKGG